MEIEKVNEVNGEISSEKFEQLKEQLKSLPAEKKQELAMFLLGRGSGLNVIVGTNVTHNITHNVANANGIVLQVGTGSDKLSEDLKQMSPEAMSELMLAIGKLIGEGDISFS